jgi:hypothetical protein
LKVLSIQSFSIRPSYLSCNTSIYLKGKRKYHGRPAFFCIRLVDIQTPIVLHLNSPTARLARSLNHSTATACTEIFSLLGASISPEARNPYGATSCVHASRILPTATAMSILYPTTSQSVSSLIHPFGTQLSLNPVCSLARLLSAALH